MWQCMGWTLGICILPFVYWLVGDWFWFLVITTAPSLIFLCFPRYMIESPRWLANKQKFSKCAEMLNRIAEINKKSVRYSEDVLKKLLGTQKEEKVYGAMSLFSHWRLARNTTILVLSWTVVNIGYMIIILNSTRMAGNPFLNFFWQSLIELPAYVMGQYLAERMGRKLTVVLAFFGAGIFCVVAIEFVTETDMEMATTCAAVLIKFFVSMNFYTVNLQAMETYPTCLRQTGISLETIVANFVGMLGPYIVVLVSKEGV